MRVKDKIYFNCLEQKLHKPNVRAVKFQRKFHPKFNTSSRVDFHHAFQRTSTHCRDCTILRVGQLLCQRWPRNVVPRKEGSGRMWYSESFVHGRNCASGASGRLWRPNGRFWGRSRQPEHPRREGEPQWCPSEKEKEGEMRDFARRKFCQSMLYIRVCVRDDDVMRVVSHAALLG